MQISLPANYDRELIPRLAPYPVAEVYGKFPSDLVGGGRPSYMGTPVSRRELRDYIAGLRDAGIAFNYLLNSSCLGNREWTRGWQRRLNRFLDRIEDMGVRRVTVSTPFLLEAVKARKPGFFVKVGIYAQVDTAGRARFWRDMGADAITLESLTVNRDFGRLRAIREAVDCELQLIANHVCMPNCPMQGYHQNGFAHASDGSGGVFLDYCFLSCTRRRLEDPSLFLRSAWIRPEDTPRYEEIGYDAFKLTERGIPSAELLKRVRAYSERRFDGNLAELMLPYGFREPVRRPRLWALRHFFKPWQVNPLRLRPILELAGRSGMTSPLESRNVHIHSDRIPADFLDHVTRPVCREGRCAECGYCAQLAEEAVEIDPEFREQALERLRTAREQMAAGELWGV